MTYWDTHTLLAPDLHGKQVSQCNLYLPGIFYSKMQCITMNLYIDLYLISNIFKHTLVFNICLIASWINIVYSLINISLLYHYSWFSLDADFSNICTIAWVSLKTWMEADVIFPLNKSTIITPNVVKCKSQTHTSKFVAVWESSHFLQGLL